jgi:hypothetical protein
MDVVIAAGRDEALLLDLLNTTPVVGTDHLTSDRLPVMGLTWVTIRIQVVSRQ